MLQLPGPDSIIEHTVRQDPILPRVFAGHRWTRMVTFPQKCIPLVDCSIEH